MIKKNKKTTEYTSAQYYGETAEYTSEQYYGETEQSANQYTEGHQYADQQYADQQYGNQQYANQQYGDQQYGEQYGGQQYGEQYGGQQYEQHQYRQWDESEVEKYASATSKKKKRAHKWGSEESYCNVRSSTCRCFFIVVYF